MTEFVARVMMKGANGYEVPRYFDLGDFTTGAPDTDYAAAVNAINQITGALAAITDAELSSVTLTGIVSESALAGAGNVFEVAQLNLYLDAAGEKTVQLYVPAPTIDIFLAAAGFNRDIVDTANADVIQYVQQIAQHAFVSDGEQVDTTVSDGIDSGRRTTRNLQIGKRKA